MEDHRPDPRMTGFDWHDNFMVARAPRFDDAAEEDAHYRRLASIVATGATMPEIGPETVSGPAVALYEARREATCPDVPVDPMDPTKAWVGAMVADVRSRTGAVVRRVTGSLRG